MHPFPGKEEERNQQLVSLLQTYIKMSLKISELVGCQKEIVLENKI